MKPLLNVVKVIFTIIVVTSVSTVLSTAIYSGTLNAVQPFIRNIPKETVRPRPDVPKDEMKDWKTYKNEKYGYEVRFPAELFAVSSDVLKDGAGREHTVLYEQTHSQQGPQGSQFSPYPFSNGLGINILEEINGTSAGSIGSLDDMKDEMVKEENKISKWTYEFKDVVFDNGTTALRLYRSSNKEYSYIYYVQGGNKIARIVAAPNLEPSEIYEKMAATFKFTEGETANWETYRNDRYGYELEYPNAYILGEGGETARPDSEKVRLVNFENTYAEITHSSVSPESAEYLQPSAAMKKNNPDKYPVNVGGVDTFLYVSKTETAREYECEASDNSLCSLSVFPMELRVKKDSDMFTFSGYFRSSFREEGTELYKKVFAAFKFTQKDETLSWETYGNEKYGLMFKYPSVLKVKEKYGEDSKLQKISLVGLEGSFDISLVDNGDMIYDNPKAAGKFRYEAETNSWISVSGGGDAEGMCGQLRYDIGGKEPSFHMGNLMADTYPRLDIVITNQKYGFEIRRDVSAGQGGNMDSNEIIALQEKIAGTIQFIGDTMAREVNPCADQPKQ